MKRSVVLLVSVASLVLFTGNGFAQTFDFGFDAPGGSTSVSGAAGSTVDIDIDMILTSTGVAGGLGAAGMSYGWSASSPEGIEFEVKERLPAACFDVNPFVAGQCLFENLPPGIFFFFTGAPVDPDMEPESGPQAGMGPQGPGYAAAIAYAFGPPPFLMPEGDGFIGKVTLSITIPATNPGTIVLQYKDGMQGPGEPLNNGVTSNNMTVAPSLGSLTITVEPQPQIVDVAVVGDTEQGVALGGTGEGDLSVAIALGSEIDGDDGIAGWQFSLRHSSNIEITGTEIAQPLFDAVPDLGGEVGFEQTDVSPAVDPDRIFMPTDPPDPACELTAGEAQGTGLTSGVTFALPPKPELDQELPGQTGGLVEVMIIHFRLVDPMGSDPVTVNFDWVNCMKGIGVQLKTGVTVGGKTVKPSSRTGLEVTIIPVLSSDFKRTDANNDGAQDLSDAVFILAYQFFGGPAPDCPDAADANNDEKINIADAVETISVTMRGKPAIPPFMDCGKDAETDEQSCPPNSSMECNARA